MRIIFMVVWRFRRRSLSAPATFTFQPPQPLTSDLQPSHSPMYMIWISIWGTNDRTVKDSPSPQRHDPLKSIQGAFENFRNTLTYIDLVTRFCVCGTDGYVKIYIYIYIIYRYNIKPACSSWQQDVIPSLFTISLQHAALLDDSQDDPQAVFKWHE